MVGRVFRVERDTDGIYLQVWADPQHSEWNTLISYFDTEFVVSDDDYVHFIGEVLGAFEGSNALGAAITAPVILAGTLEVVDATAAASKAIRTAEVNLSSSQHAIEVGVPKVEFASDETRIYVKVVNGSNEIAHFYDFDTKATQGSQQFEPQSFTDYPSVQSELLPGIESSGLVVFDAMNPATETKTYLEARSEDYSLDFTPYVFTVPAS